MRFPSPLRHYIPLLLQSGPAFAFRSLLNPPSRPSTGPHPRTSAPYGTFLSVQKFLVTLLPFQALFFQPTL